MANPIFIPIRFAANGLKSVIQKVLQSGQDPEDMTWNLGTPQITMIPKEDGGLPPKGQDFNGILYTLSDHAVQRQNGEQILFSDGVVTEYGGYALGSIVQSNDTLRHFRSLINNNTFNPNTQPISGRWEIYTGAGSIPTASSTTAGVIRVINDLTSSEVGAALSAAMGKVLNDILNKFIIQSSQNGRIEIPFGNKTFMLQWGLTGMIPPRSQVTVNFSKDFTAPVLNLQATHTTINDRAPIVRNGTRTGFIAENYDTVTTVQYYWLAIGY